MSGTAQAQIQALRTGGLGDEILLPGSDGYESRIKSWWSTSARLRPCCIVQPRSTEDVAASIKALASVGAGEFAIRSGGHSHWAGGSNIDGGVTIDLLHVNDATAYDPATKIASLGPAQRWRDVYLALESKGVMVPGGRDGGVGVGGLMTGGGNSYYTGRHGFVCDNLVNAQVVLADGRIVDANATHNSDLWKALKGGLGNFGIVTRFDVRAFEAGQVWGGIRVSATSRTDDLIDTLIHFTKHNHRYPEAAYILTFTYQPQLSRELMVALVLVDTDGVANPAAFETVQKIPAVFSDLKMRPMSGIANEYVLPANLRNVWFTLTFKNDARVVKKAADLHESFVADLLIDIPAEDFSSQSLWQPIPRMFADIGLSKGGNVLGLDQVQGDCLLWLCAASVKAREHECLLRQKAEAMTEELGSYAESIDATVPWIYANYADPSQEPLKSYGETNSEFMKGVAAKYDPDAVFQRMVPGSFKLAGNMAVQEAGCRK